MKLILKAAIAAGTLTLAACNNHSDAGDNIVANTENLADNMEATADNMSNGAAADVLDNQAAATRAAGENAADTADNAAHADGNSH
jgi:protein involved in sex pheromone biosynthesis